jgi:hypothetical protein
MAALVHCFRTIFQHFLEANTVILRVNLDYITDSASYISLILILIPVRTSLAANLSSYRNSIKQKVIKAHEVADSTSIMSFYLKNCLLLLLQYVEFLYNLYSVKNALAICTFSTFDNTEINLKMCFTSNK